MPDDVHAKFGDVARGVAHFIDGEGDPVKRDRAFRRQAASEPWGTPEDEPQAVAFGPPVQDLGHAVDMAVDQMPPQLIPQPQGPFEIDLCADLPPA